MNEFSDSVMYDCILHTLASHMTAGYATSGLAVNGSFRSVMLMDAVPSVADWINRNYDTFCSRSRLTYRSLSYSCPILGWYRPVAHSCSYHALHDNESEM